MESLRSYTNLKPILGVIPAQSAHCIVLKGTVPMFFRGNKYNTPVGVWIPSTYPSTAPLPYVLPTKGVMFIRPNHPHVDQYGRVTLDSITSWRQGSTITNVLSEMCAVFGANPPVSSGTAIPVSQHAAMRRPQPQVQPLTQMQQRPEQQRQQMYSNQSGPVHSFQSDMAYGRPVMQGHSGTDQRSKLTSALTVRLHNDMAKHRAAVVQYANDATRLMAGAREDVRQKQATLNDMDGEVAALEQAIADDSRELAAVTARLEQMAAVGATKPVPDRCALDDATDSANASRRQMARLAAEDRALEDAMYKVYQAMDDEEVDLADGLKAIRRLSKDQFMRRALIWKIGQMRQRYASEMQAQAAMVENTTVRPR